MSLLMDSSATAGVDSPMAIEANARVRMVVFIFNGDVIRFAVFSLIILHLFRVNAWVCPLILIIGSAGRVKIQPATPKLRVATRRWCSVPRFP